MEILVFPDIKLFTPCKEVTVFGSELYVLLEAMWDTMVQHKGIGLAANQVGMSYRMFTMVGPQKEKLFIVNPKIVRKSALFASMEEGCLSAPGEFVIIKDRREWVELEFQNELGEVKTMIFDGIRAVCVQHEIDHLDGKSHLESKTIPRERRRQIAKKWGLRKK